MRPISSCDPSICQIWPPSNGWRLTRFLRSLLFMGRIVSEYPVGEDLIIFGPARCATYHFGLVFAIEPPAAGEGPAGCDGDGGVGRQDAVGVKLGRVAVASDGDVRPLPDGRGALSSL